MNTRSIWLCQDYLCLIHTISNAIKTDKYTLSSSNTYLYTQHTHRNTRITDISHTGISNTLTRTFTQTFPHAHMYEWKKQKKDHHTATSTLRGPYLHTKSYTGIFRCCCCRCRRRRRCCCCCVISCSFIQFVMRSTRCTLCSTISLFLLVELDL